MRVLQIAGPSGLGKTRLLEAILPDVPAVLVVKWTHHPLLADRAESDTQRLAAVPTLLGAPDGLTLRHPGLSRADLYRRLAKLLAEDDLVVVEGDKHAGHPKIWVGASPPEDVRPVSLAIGPDPASDYPVLTLALPLTDDGVIEAAEYLRTNWRRFCTTVVEG